MFAGVQDSDVRSLRRHSAAESLDERLEDGVSNVCWESDTWRRWCDAEMEQTAHWNCWPRSTIQVSFTPCLKKLCQCYFLN